MQILFTQMHSNILYIILTLRVFDVKRMFKLSSEFSYMKMNDTEFRVKRFQLYLSYLMTDGYSLHCYPTEQFFASRETYRSFAV